MISNSSENDVSKNNVNQLLPWILMGAVNLLMVLFLWTQGRIWWCKWDTPAYIASFSAWSKHTSQHFFDPYSFTHVLHGFLFFWLLDLIFNKFEVKKLSFAWLMFWAVFIEAAWEVLENSSFIIERYREHTASLDYFGDSIGNAFGDVLACMLGVYIACKLKFWWSLAVFLIVELILVITIRDSLLINIIMLIYPIEALKNWQTVGNEAVQTLALFF